MKLSPFLLFTYTLNLSIGLTTETKPGYPPGNLLLAVLCAVIGLGQALNDWRYQRQAAALLARINAAADKEGDQ